MFWCALCSLHQCAAQFNTAVPRKGYAHVCYEKMLLFRMLKESVGFPAFCELHRFCTRVGFSSLQLETGPLSLETWKAGANITETQYFMLNVMNSWNIWVMPLSWLESLKFVLVEDRGHESIFPCCFFFNYCYLEMCTRAFKQTRGKALPSPESEVRKSQPCGASGAGQLRCLSTPDYRCRPR